ncbi:MAG: nucleoside triphosphate pyrophosphohydrolase [Thermoplasmatota archaeon]
MARILVQSPPDLQSTAIRDALVEQIREDGHDAAALGNLSRDLTEGDALVVLADRADGATGAAAGFALALKKPVLALHSDALPAGFEGATPGKASDVEGWFQLLPEFYEAVRPFAGRLVRDLIPQLVKDAGHDVKFRSLDNADKPAFLKQKVVDEAMELLHADLGQETEEVGDVLEALESLIRVRDYGRDNLRRVKEGKKKRRGGFERCWVVEATSTETSAREPEAAPEPPTAEPEPAANDAPATEPAAPKRHTEFYEV